jgi:site-specific recombinase XerD
MNAKPAVVYQVIREYDPNAEYSVKIRKQYCNILRSLKKGEEFTVSEKQPELQKLVRSDDIKTVKDTISKALKIGKDVGIVVQKQSDYVTPQQFRELETIKNLQVGLKQSKFLHDKESQIMSNTFDLYTLGLRKFSMWLKGKHMRLLKEVQLENDSYTKQMVDVTVEDLEHFLELYRDSPSNKENIKFVRLCLEFLNSSENRKYSVSYMVSMHSAIQAYFRINLSPIEIPFDAKNSHQMILQEQLHGSELTVDDMFKILTDGKPSLLEKTVVMCKWHRGLDDSTFADRFNYVVWDQLVKYFGTTEFDAWDLTKCPAPIWLTRVKTGYYHLGFLDHDAVKLIQHYLRFLKNKKNKTMKPGEPLFVTARGTPVSTKWVSRVIPNLADVAGVQKIVDSYNSGYRRRTKTGHEVRDLLESIILDHELPEWFADMCIGHKIPDTYEKQAQLFPEKQRIRYSKISRYVNIFTKATLSLKENSDPNIMQYEINDLKAKLEQTTAQKKATDEELQELKQWRKSVDAHMQRENMRKYGTTTPESI